MSTILLSLLLLFLIAVGLLMGRQVAERFENPPTPQPTLVSPALKNLIVPPQPAEHKAPLQVDTLERDLAVQQTGQVGNCPKCPVCPDMSQYIRADEIPCWNCDVASTMHYPPENGTA
jgi:hypothetical protein